MDHLKKPDRTGKHQILPRETPRLIRPPEQRLLDPFTADGVLSEFWRENRQIREADKTDLHRVNDTLRDGLPATKVEARPSRPKAIPADTQMNDCAPVGVNRSSVTA